MSPYDFLGISLIILMFAGGFLARRNEKKEWNNGWCAECGSSWKQFDTDSQGGRMYVCDKQHYCNVSYNVDKNIKQI